MLTTSNENLSSGNDETWSEFTREATPPALTHPQRTAAPSPLAPVLMARWIRRGGGQPISHIFYWRDMLTTWNENRSGGNDEIGSGFMCAQVVYAVAATEEFK